MAGRRVVVEANALGAPALATSCPWCNASLSWAKKVDLQPIVHSLFRCRSGHHPRAYELRCRECNGIAIVYDAENGLALLSGDQKELLRRVRELERESFATGRGRHERE